MIMTNIRGKPYSYKETMTEKKEYPECKGCILEDFCEEHGEKFEKKEGD